MHIGLDYQGLAEAQRQDPQTEVIKTTPMALKLEDVALDDSTTILCDTLTGRPHSLVPEMWRRKVFDMIHGLAHPAGRTTARLMKKTQRPGQDIAQNVRKQKSPDTQNQE